jgi:regulator of replication initiation timing
VVMKNIIQSLTKPEQAAMVSIFVPGELVTAAGLNQEKLRELESHMLEYKVQVSDLKRQLQEKDADTQNQLKQAQMEADLKLERAVIAKERELQEELRTSDRENVRLQTELEQLRASLAPNQNQANKE